MVEQVLPALVDALDLVVDLALLGLVAGGDELLSQLLQVSLVLTEQVDLLHAVLQRQSERKGLGFALSDAHWTPGVYLGTFIKIKQTFKIRNTFA